MEGAGEVPRLPKRAARLASSAEVSFDFLEKKPIVSVSEGVDVGLESLGGCRCCRCSCRVDVDVDVEDKKMEGVSEWGMSVIKGNSCDVQEGLRRELKQLLAAELELSKY